METSATLDVVYRRLCKARRQEPQDCVEIKLQAFYSRSDGVVDLSNLTITASTCSILAEIFRDDVEVVKLILADCMISEKSLKCLLSGLASNPCIKELDLRGNNLRQLSCEALGSLLKSNQSIKRLLLEWNCLGSFNSSFAHFCDGLATNTSLCHLDLRNNQIDHKGAKEIANALRYNKGLKSLDLRWNNIGLNGGRLISDALKKNKTLQTLEISGNNIPVDVCDNMETSLNCNRSSSSSSKDDDIRLNYLHKEIDMLRHENQMQMNSIVTKKTSKRKMVEIPSCSTTQMFNLHQTLEERKSAMNTLRAKLDMAEASLEMMQQQTQDKEMLVQLARRDCQELIKTHECERQRDRKNNEALACKLQESLEESQFKISDLESKLADTCRKLKNNEDEMCLLKKTFNQAQCDHRTEMTSLEERTNCEKKRLLQELKEKEKRLEQDVCKQLEKAQQMRSCSETRVEQVLKSKCEMQNEVAALNKKLVCCQQQHDEELRKLSCQLKQESEMKCSQLDERIRCLLCDKSDLQKSLSLANGLLQEEKTTREALEIEVKSCRNSLNKMKQEIENREMDYEQEVQNIRIEMRKREMQNQEELNRVSELRATINKMMRSQDDQDRDFRAALKERDEMICSLQASLRKYEDEVDRTREEESRRLDVLHNALMSYMQSSQLNKSSPLRRSQASNKLLADTNVVDENPL